MNKVMIGRNVQTKSVKSSQTIRAKKPIDQQIKEDIKRNIDVYVRLSNK